MILCLEYENNDAYERWKCREIMKDFIMWQYFLFMAPQTSKKFGALVIFSESGREIQLASSIKSGTNEWKKNRPLS